MYRSYKKLTLNQSAIRKIIVDLDPEEVERLFQTDAQDLENKEKFDLFRLEDPKIYCLRLWKSDNLHCLITAEEKSNNTWTSIYQSSFGSSYH